MTPEGKIKQKIDKMLKAKKDVWFFKPQAGPFGRSGVPDYIICNNGFFLGIEAKAGKSRKPTALQEQCMEKIIGAKGTCFVVYDDATLRRVEVAIDKVAEFVSLSGRLIAERAIAEETTH